MADSLELAAFVEATGDSLARAQQEIAGAELATTAVALAEARLEAKVGLAVDGGGKVSVQPIGRAELASAGKSAASVSTVSVSFVALAEDDTATGQTPPTIGKGPAIDVLAGRDDVVKLAEILGPLRFDATFIPEKATWLVAAFDERGHKVREALIAGDG